MTSRRLVLASTSAYRRELLARLGLAFEVAAPGVDETLQAGENPAAAAARLAEAKARAVAPAFPGALVIGSDQVAALDGAQLGKPGTHENARRQLERMSGRSVVFHTALCLLDAASGRAQTRVVPCEVAFRELEGGEIARYLERERPYDCAGAARVEGLGIALIRSLRADDPTALIGLPLIALVDLLRAEGVSVL